MENGLTTPFIQSFLSCCKSTISPMRNGKVRRILSQKTCQITVT